MAGVRLDARPEKRLPGRRRAGSSGFSLVELMVVVAIVGVLAAVGIGLLRKYIVSSKSSEAVTVVQAIRVAQERFRAENQVYLNVSGGDLTRYYPTAEPGNRLYNWDQEGGNDYAAWQLLGPPVTIPVRFGYATVAGGVGDALPALETARAAPWNAGTQVVEPWYVVQARGDPDEDGTFTFFVATSFNGELYQEDGNVE